MIVDSRTDFRGKSFSGFYARHWLKRMLLRPFGEDVAQHSLSAGMPMAAKCVQETSHGFLLSSSGQKWLPARIAMTRSKLCISKSRDKSKAVHTIPLHEIIRISPGASLALPDGTSLLQDIQYMSDSSLEEDSPESTKPETVGQAILELETDKAGFNFGRVFILNLGSGTAVDAWMRDLEILRVEETHAYIRRTLINRKQAAIGKFYESKQVQYSVAVMIVANFLLEAVNTEVSWDADGVEAQHVSNMDR